MRHEHDIAPDAPRLNPGDGERARLLGAARAGGMLVTHKCYRSDFAQGWHEHPNATVELVLAGSGVGTYGGIRLESVAGAVEFFRAGVRHRFAAGRAGIRTLHVAFPASLDAAAQPDVVVEALEATVAQPLALAILHELAEPELDLSRGLSIESLAQELLAQVRLAARGDRRRPAWMSAAVEAVRAAPVGAASLGAIASEVGIERAHLARTFRRFTGVSVGEYHRRARLAAAARKLAGTDAPISRVAFEHGFADQAHFTRRFRRHFGLTPRAYRERLRST
ncbi:MAG TPA: AraC family transcriptional regulator [Phycisphaerales bacterium]|nr:AraC family transcriptional regulator [Phycisphaerales bacterium]